MTWVKVDDAFPEHRKVVEAGRHLGPYGRGRVIAVWQVGMCYCNRNLTDGFVDEATVRSWIPYDRRPLDVANVMALPMPDGGPCLLIRVEGGFRFHDFNDYQPASASVKAKREKDRQRKRGGKDSNGSSAGFRAESVGIPVTPCPCPTPIPRSQEQGADAPSIPVLTKLVHCVLDEDRDKPWDFSELAEEVKQRAAAADIGYDSTAVGRAIESAAFQRTGRKRPRIAS